MRFDRDDGYRDFMDADDPGSATWCILYGSSSDSSDRSDDLAFDDDDLKRYQAAVRAWWQHLVDTGQARALARWWADPRSVYGPLPRPLPPPHPLHDIDRTGRVTRERAIREVLYSHDLERVLKALNRLPGVYTPEQVRLAALALQCEEAGIPFHRPPPPPARDAGTADDRQPPQRLWHAWLSALAQCGAAAPTAPPSPPGSADPSHRPRRRTSWTSGFRNR